MVTVVVVVTMLPVMAMGCSEFLQHRLLMLGNDDLKDPPQTSPERAARHQRKDRPRQHNISWIVACNPRQHCHGKAAQAKTTGGNGDQVGSRVLHHSQCRSAATAPGTAVRGFGPSAAALKRSAQQHRDFLEVLEISDAGRSGIASDLPTWRTCHCHAAEREQTGAPRDQTFGPSSTNPARRDELPCSMSAGTS